MALAWMVKEIIILDEFDGSDKRVRGDNGDTNQKPRHHVHCVSIFNLERRGRQRSIDPRMGRIRIRVEEDQWGVGRNLVSREWVAIFEDLSSVNQSLSIFRYIFED
jgi:hypothetical protein